MGGKPNRINNPHDINKGKNIKIATVQIPNYDYPIFCFKHLHKDHHLDHCTSDEKKSFIERLVLLSQMTWEQIKLAPRHGLGTEKIAVGSIKKGVPSFITEDVTFLLALRFDGKKPFIGHRNQFIFHVIFIDRDFTCYNH